MKIYQRRLAQSLCLLVLSGSACVYAKAPTMDPAADAKNLGPPENFLFWTPEQQVASYRNINMIFPTRAVASNRPDWALQAALFTVLSKAVSN